LLDACRLKLYPTDGTALALDRPVIDDHYDEIVFNSLPPDPAVRAALEAGAWALALQSSCVPSKACLQAEELGAALRLECAEGRWDWVAASETPGAACLCTALRVDLFGRVSPAFTVLPRCPLSTAGPTKPQPPISHGDLLPVYDASEDLVRVQAARIKLGRDMEELRERLAMRRQESARMKEDLRTLGLL
jgi:hypothetical protein